ncbi:MAG TPA: ABC transporter substrate-binding protein [Propionibacteriaceae bacterium]|nr:ABC transporter substrate-binding protein [Propionibacteriaceae bacterium]
MRSSRIAATLAAATLVLAGCGANSDPLATESAAPSGSASGPVVVGSANFTESQVLAELYAQAMKAKDVDASTKLNIGSREVYIKALQDESISMIPEYTGNLLLYFDPKASATTAEEVEKALPAAIGDLKTLKPSSAADQDVYVVTKETSQQKGITSLKDLKKISANSILGGPSELKDRAYGPEGLKSIYGATFKQFRPYDSPAVKVKDLNDNKIQVAEFFTTESAIVDNGYVQLEDPQAMILPQNVIPLIRPEVAENTAATGAVEAVQAALTTEELTALNKKVDVDRQEPAEVAEEWLQSKGLS